MNGMNRRLAVRHLALRLTGLEGGNNCDQWIAAPEDRYQRRRGERRLVAHRVTSLPRSIAVAFGAEWTWTFAETKTPLPPPEQPFDVGEL